MALRTDVRPPVPILANKVAVSKFTSAYQVSCAPPQGNKSLQFLASSAITLPLLVHKLSRLPPSDTVPETEPDCTNWYATLFRVDDAAHYNVVVVGKPKIVHMPGEHAGTIIEKRDMHGPSHRNIAGKSDLRVKVQLGW